MTVETSSTIPSREPPSLDGLYDRMTPDHALVLVERLSRLGARSLRRTCRHRSMSARCAGGAARRSRSLRGARGARSSCAHRPIGAADMHRERRGYLGDHRAVIFSQAATAASAWSFPTERLRMLPRIAVSVSPFATIGVLPNHLLPWRPYIEPGATFVFEAIRINVLKR